MAGKRGRISENVRERPNNDLLVSRSPNHESRSAASNIQFPDIQIFNYIKVLSDCSSGIGLLWFLSGSLKEAPVSGTFASCA